MKLIFDLIYAIAGWFSPLLRRAGWFDQELIDEPPAGEGGVIVRRRHRRREPRPEPPGVELPRAPLPAFVGIGHVELPPIKAGGRAWITNERMRA